MSLFSHFTSNLARDFFVLSNAMYLGGKNSLRQRRSNLRFAVLLVEEKLVESSHRKLTTSSGLGVPLVTRGLRTNLRIIQCRRVSGTTSDGPSDSVMPIKEASRTSRSLMTDSA